MKLTSLIIILFIFTSFFGAEQAFALTASPVTVEVTGEVGQTLRGEIELFNEQDEQKVLFSSFENFEPQGDTGSPRFIGSETGLATWMSAEESIAVEPGERKVIPYTITIPADAEAGGYFAAIFFGSQDPKTQESGEVSIGGKLGILVLLRVAGDIVEEGGLSEFKTKNAERVFSSLPVHLSYRFSNSGGDRIVPLGDITIKNTFGRTSAVLEANKNEGSVLPNSVRTFESVWGLISTSSEKISFVEHVKNQYSSFHFGLYTASVSLVYGSTNQTAQDSFVFFVFPWQLLLVCSLVLTMAYLSLRKYNSWIISKSKASS